MEFPKELKYIKSHEYLRVQGNTATIGITSYASGELGDVVYVDLPETGKKYNAGEKFGVIESVKSVSDLYTPCTGKIIEVNNDLSDHPEYVNEDPYGKGWMIKMELTSDLNGNKDLISADEYKKFVLAN